MYDHTFLKLANARSDIRPHIKWAVSLVFAYSHQPDCLLLKACTVVYVNRTFVTLITTFNINYHLSSIGRLAYVLTLGGVDICSLDAFKIQRLN